MCSGGLALWSDPPGSMASHVVGHSGPEVPTRGTEVPVKEIRVATPFFAIAG